MRQPGSPSVLRGSMTGVRKSLLLATVLFWAGLSFLSINYLYPFSDFLTVPTFLLGLLGWLAFFLTVVVLGLNQLKKILLVFLLFFAVGYMVGPFLEPPGDPLDHLRLSYSFCDRKSDETNRRFKGLWQYSMNATVLCSETGSGDPEKIMRKINFLHGMYWGGGAAVLYLVSSAAGLSFKWSLMSILIAYLFMGTNRFSYFSYYSFAPSFSSLWLYWLWIAAFFFQRNVKTICAGMIAAVLAVPIILTNHIQEAVFLGLLVAIWLVLNFHERLWSSLIGREFCAGDDRECMTRTGLKWVYLLLAFIVLWILPQNEWFRETLASVFIFDNWKLNQDAVYSLGGFHLMGKIWGYRVHDTLGLMGILPLLMTPYLLWQNNARLRPGWLQGRIIILGILPLLVYCIPLLHFIWLSNCERVPTHIRYYYRMCYSSLFWLPITLFFVMLEERFGGLRVPELSIGGDGRNLGGAVGFLFRNVFLICLLAVLALSTVRSGPVYGKTDFILVDSSIWWKEWKPMITELYGGNYQKIFTDPMTQTVLRNVFNLPTRVIRSGGVPFNGSDVQWLDKIGRRKKADCLINLHSYRSTWVPYETDHWFPYYTDTASYYSFNGLKGDALRNYLRNNPLQNCYVYY